MGKSLVSCFFETQCSNLHVCLLHSLCVLFVLKEHSIKSINITSSGELILYIAGSCMLCCCIIYNLFTLSV